MRFWVLGLGFRVQGGDRGLWSRVGCGVKGSGLRFTDASMIQAPSRFDGARNPEQPWNDSGCSNMAHMSEDPPPNCMLPTKT